MEITAGSGDVRIESVDDDIRLIASDDILLEASGAMRLVAVNSARIESTTDDVVIQSVADDVRLIAEDSIFIDAVNDVVIRNTTNFAVTVSNDLIATVANDVSFHGKAVYLTADTNLSVNADSLDAYTANSIVLDSGTEVTLTAPSVKVNGAALLAPVYGEFLATEQGTIADNDLVVLDTAGAANSTGVSSASGTITLDAVGLYEVSWRVHATRATAGLIKLGLMCLAGEINGVLATVVIPTTTVGSSAAAAALVEITGRALINAIDTVTASAFGIVNLSGVNIDVGAVDLWENIIVRRVDYMTV